MSLLEQFLPIISFRSGTKRRCDAGRLNCSTSSRIFSLPRIARGDVAMFLRQVPAKLMHWAAPSRVPRPSPVTRANFTPLARYGDREIVGGLIGKFWRPTLDCWRSRGLPSSSPATRPRRQSWCSDFLPSPSERIRLLTTETRVYCPDCYPLLMFTPYWLAIRPVSGLLRAANAQHHPRNRRTSRWSLGRRRSYLTRHARRATTATIHAPVPAPPDRLPHRRDRRDALPARRAGPHRRRLRLCGAAAAGPPREAAGLRLHLGGHPEDPGARARSRARLLRPAGRHRRRSRARGRRRPSSSTSATLPASSR